MLTRLVAGCLVAWILLAPGTSRACSDAGVPEGGVAPFTPMPFDAGPGCTIELRGIDASCGPGGSYYVAVCPLADAGPPDVGTDAAMCHEIQDTAVDGPPNVHYACASNADCEGVWHGMTCGSAGFCVCPVASAGSGCSVARGRTTHGAAIGLFAVVALLFRRRRRFARAASVFAA